PRNAVQRSPVHFDPTPSNHRIPTDVRVSCMAKHNRSVRSVRLFLIAAVLTLTGLVTGLPTPTMAKGEDATPLLEKAAQTMSQVQSFRFELRTVQGESLIMNNLELSRVVGSVQRPASFEATITAKVAVIDVDVRIVGIGTRLWVTDPLSKEETYIEVTGEG